MASTPEAIHNATTETAPERRQDSGAAPGGAGEAMPKQVRTRIEYRRFNLFHRWMHFLVFVSFTVLVFTGMPLKYADSGFKYESTSKHVQTF